VEAVISELVSVRRFPVMRENTAKFFDFRLRDGDCPCFRTGNSIAYKGNSLNTETGNFLGRTGKLGTSSREARHHAGLLEGASPRRAKDNRSGAIASPVEIGPIASLS
jgi:hypothetical protein